MTFNFFSSLETNIVKKRFIRQPENHICSYFGKKNDKALVSTSLIFTFQVRSVIVFFMVIVVMNPSFIGHHTPISQIMIISDDI